MPLSKTQPLHILLESSVAVEKRMHFRICAYRLVKRIEYKRIVVAVADLVRNDPSVIQIEDCTQIHFLYFLFRLLDIKHPHRVVLEFFVSSSVYSMGIISSFDVVFSCLPECTAPSGSEPFT